MAKPKMVMRSLRVREASWDKAKAKADKHNQDWSAVLRELIEQYAEDDE